MTEQITEATNTLWAIRATLDKNSCEMIFSATQIAQAITYAVGVEMEWENGFTLVRNPSVRGELMMIHGSAPYFDLADDIEDIDFEDLPLHVVKQFLIEVEGGWLDSVLAMAASNRDRI